VGLGFLAQFIGIGVSAYATSIFFQAMFTDLGWSRGDLALSISVGSILAAIAGPFVGTIVDKHGAGKIMAIGALATGVCLMFLGLIQELWQAFAIFSILALFRVGFVTIPGLVMVSHWFLKKRGRALGIMTAGQGMGGLVLSPLTTWLISQSGWRISWVVFGIITCAVMIPAALLLAKPKPDSVGVDGIPLANPGAGALKDKEMVTAQNQGWTLKNIFRMPAFWLIALLYPFYVFGHASVFQHGYSLFIDKGIAALTAGTMMSVLGLVSMSGKIALGYLSDKMPVRYVMMIALTIAAASIFLLFLDQAALGAWLFILTWGFWECGIIALQPVMVANAFDKAIIGKMLGLFTLFTVFPQLIGPAFTGYVFDITGSYNLALLVILALYLTSLTMVFFTGFSRKSKEKSLLVGS
jgi:sugar phosphate permease